ncbi:hypothetical protein Sfulv_05710 [Streptomyces fulvorobeus]|uniref:Uncharacterized protein n=1 Tax=Streptomyces fulvorobeus TaxID=284028 RepID=A0A7J0BZR9_9ACTN|nr:hypothetical protein Sfulv_05710 [Streptomyces fulvorobeus]
MEHRVSHGDEDAEGHDQYAGHHEAAARAVDDGLDGETHGEREPGDGALVEQAPREGLELSRELVAPEPEQEPWT